MKSAPSHSGTHPQAKPTVTYVPGQSVTYVPGQSVTYVPVRTPVRTGQGTRGQCSSFDSF